jgi:hypothetical protein
VAEVIAADGRPTFADSEAQPSASRLLTHAGEGERVLGYTQIALWPRWEVQNSADNEHRWALQVAEPTLGRVDTDRVSAGKIEQIAQTGDAHPFGARLIRGTARTHDAERGRKTESAVPIQVSSGISGTLAVAHSESDEREALAHLVVARALGSGATFAVRLPREARSRAATPFSSRDAVAAERVVGA